MVVQLLSQNPTEVSWPAKILIGLGALNEVDSLDALRQLNRDDQYIDAIH